MMMMMSNVEKTKPLAFLATYDIDIVRVAGRIFNIHKRRRKTFRSKV
jgi:hypothetical protein